MKRKLKFFLTFFSLSVLLWLFTGYLSARYLTGTNPHNFQMPELKNHNVREVSIYTEDSLRISASFVEGSLEKAVIILGGIGANRLSCLSRMENYASLGYSVLLPDLRGTGKSEGNTISFGWQERKDLIACYNFLKKTKIKKIGVHGCSLGAATIAYSLQEVNDYSFIVLESCYDNLENAFYNRVEKFPLPHIAYYPVHLFVNNLISASIEDLQPSEFVKAASCPMLLMAGDSEDQLKLSETKKIFKNCGSKDKTLFIFKGGKHEDFQNRFKEEYNLVLNRFLNKFN